MPSDQTRQRTRTYIQLPSHPRYREMTGGGHARPVFDFIEPPARGEHQAPPPGPRGESPG